MFNLTLHDHLHLTFTEIIQRHNAHVGKAQSLGRWSRRLRGSQAMLVGGVALAAGGAAYGNGRALAIVAASLAGLALAILLVDLAFDFDASARGHAVSSAHLWRMRERYRSLLSDLHDGALSLEEVRLRRDRLIDELKAIYDTSSMVALQEAVAPASAPDEVTVAPQPAAHSNA